MGQYVIKELEQLSGIKAHTIRIWEKRYHLLNPQRTTSNIRYYSDQDLKKIINVAMLHRSGMKISKISPLSEKEISEKVLAFEGKENDKKIPINQLIMAMVDMEEETFEKILSSQILKFGFENTMVEMIYPFLDKIGVLWQTNHVSPAQEHFISNLIRQKIIVAIDALSLPPPSTSKVLLFLPENEMHELGLLFYHYLIRKKGYRTYYFGQNLPYEDLKEVIRIHNPDMLFTSITCSLKDFTIEDFLHQLVHHFPNQKILVSGFQIQSVIKVHPSIHLIKKMEDLRLAFE